MVVHGRSLVRNSKRREDHVGTRSHAVALVCMLMLDKNFSGRKKIEFY